MTSSFFRQNMTSESRRTKPTIRPTSFASLDMSLANFAAARPHLQSARPPVFSSTVSSTSINYSRLLSSATPIIATPKLSSPPYSAARSKVQATTTAAQSWWASLSSSTHQGHCYSPPSSLSMLQSSTAPCLLFSPAEPSQSQLSTPTSLSSLVPDTIQPDGEDPLITIRLPTLNRVDSSLLDMPSFLLFSGIGMIALRAALYPVNVIKTRLQATTPIPSENPMISIVTERPLNSAKNSVKNAHSLRTLLTRPISAFPAFLTATAALATARLAHPVAAFRSLPRYFERLMQRFQTRPGSNIRPPNANTATPINPQETTMKTAQSTSATSSQNPPPSQQLSPSTLPNHQTSNQVTGNLPPQPLPNTVQPPVNSIHPTIAPSSHGAVPSTTIPTAQQTSLPRTTSTSRTPPQRKTALSIAMSILRNEGIAPLFAGLGLSLTLTASRQMYFWIYETLRSQFISLNDQFQFLTNDNILTAVKDSSSAFLATVIYQIFANPLDLVVQRLMTHSRALQKVSHMSNVQAADAASAAAAAGTTTTSHQTATVHATPSAKPSSAAAAAFDPYAVAEAPISRHRVVNMLSTHFNAFRLTRNLLYADPSCFYRGFVSSTVLWSLSSCIWWGSFELILQRLTSLLPASSPQNSQFVHWFDHFLSQPSLDLLHNHCWYGQHAAALISSSLSVLLTHPLDTARTRLMVYCRRGDGLTATRACRELIAQEGFRGLLAGLGTRLVFLVPTSVLTMAIYQIGKVLSLEVSFRRAGIIEENPHYQGGGGSAVITSSQQSMKEVSSSSTTPLYLELCGHLLKPHVAYSFGSPYSYIRYNPTLLYPDSNNNSTSASSTSSGSPTASTTLSLPKSPTWNESSLPYFPSNQPDSIQVAVTSISAQTRALGQAANQLLSDQQQQQLQQQQQSSTSTTTSSGEAHMPTNELLQQLSHVQSLVVELERQVSLLQQQHVQSRHNHHNGATALLFYHDELPCAAAEQEHAKMLGYNSLHPVQHPPHGLSQLLLGENAEEIDDTEDSALVGQLVV